MLGKIVKGISGFYYVFVAGTGIYECRAKGILRKQKMKPLVGDWVEMAVLDEAERLGNVETVLSRTNALVRPAVANIDLALVIFAAAKPAPGYNLLDRFLCMMEFQGVPAVICFNKCDLVTEEEKQRLRQIYAPAGYQVLFVSAKTGECLEALRELLDGKTASVAGPSGVGKSSLINALQSEVQMETGAISERVERGRHTTRHAQIIPLAADTFIMDTPGFSSMDVPGLEKEKLWTCYPEFVPYEPSCRFIGCSHLREPDCGVKQAVEEGKISPVRYENYRLLYEELKNIRRY
ncbi:MAG: ribosome small subunit-dependent GTPase A [Blautia sp.]|nr:ribosome small subunit-dependent GTPase A [Blautia sp.]